MKAFIILVSISIFCKSIEVFYASHTLCSYHHHHPENKKRHKLKPVRPVWVMVPGVNKPFTLSELPFPTESHRHLFSWRLAQDQDYIFYFFNTNLHIYIFLEQGILDKIKAKSVNNVSLQLKVVNYVYSKICKQDYILKELSVVSRMPTDLYCYSKTISKINFTG